MVKNTRRVKRGEEALSRERIIEAAIALLDTAGEGGMTFRALAERLGTGPGAIYWHIANKDDLLSAACDAIVTGALGSAPPDGSPRDVVRAVGVALFDAIDAHPWAGAELMRAAWKMPMVRMLEAIGRQVQALGVPPQSLQPATFVLLSYIVSGATQNAANGEMARQRGFVRGDFLDQVASAWEGLDAEEFSFVRSVAGQLRDHDDRADFLAGVELILAGLEGGNL